MLVGDARALETGVGLSDDNADAWENRSRFIGDDAPKFCSLRISHGRKERAEEKADEKEEEQRQQKCPFQELVREHRDLRDYHPQGQVLR